VRRKKSWVYSPGWRPTVSPEVAGRELHRIGMKKGHVRPRDVWEESRDSDAPLHRCFEWNDEKAAVIYRDRQARNLIGALRIVYEDDPVQEQRIEFFHVDHEKHGSTYIPSRRLGEADYARQVVRDCLRLMMGVRTRYKQVHELASLYTQIDDLVEQYLPEAAAARKRKKKVAAKKRQANDKAVSAR